VTTEFLARMVNAPETRNAGIALQRPIRHDPIAIELHDQTSEALANGCGGRRHPPREKASHRLAG
jgi:hypothetical protein